MFVILGPQSRIRPDLVEP